MTVQTPLVSIAREPADALAQQPAVEWAVEQLRSALQSKGARVESFDVLGAAPADQVIVVADTNSDRALRIIADAGVSVPAVPEALGLVPDRPGSLLAAGFDERGLVYALLELADRVQHEDDPVQALRLAAPVIEHPANAVRSVARCFASEVDDKPWLHDEGFWQRYLSMVATQRFNRFNLMVGLGYNFPWHVTDAYLFFAYPFLVDVPGHHVRIPQLSDEERGRNLEMLRFVSNATAARGLEFQLGLWTHAYEWFDSPTARHTVQGLTPENHAAYCRDALAAVLDACPAISGLTLRTHGESGVAERSWDFWRTVLDGVTRSGRRVGIDLHAKGLDRETLDIALATGMPITVSPKYSAEHMGMPYHQAAIRELDRPPVIDYDGDAGKARYMAVCEGSRPFTRYSYGDLLREGRPYDVVYRIWPGTQRVLLWGDPAMASGYGRVASFAGSQGLEWCEPHSLKGREGTGRPGPRDGYADPVLSSPADWEKHAYTYRLFGRLMYNPDADPETWRRALRSQCGSAGESAESALASASRILPLVTTAHHPSASNNYYWPEMYTDIGVVARDDAPETHYYDTPVPKRFGTVGPLDPEVFSGVADCVHEAVAGRPSGRFSPWVVAGWLEGLSADASEHAGRVAKDVGGTPSAAVRRLTVDVAIQADLGRFFAAKLKAAVLYEISLSTASGAMLTAAVESYRRARNAWADVVDRARGVYVDDLTYGPQPWLRGNWADRMAAIDDDLEALTTAAARTRPESPAADGEAHRLLGFVAGQGVAAVELAHISPPRFRPGEPITVVLHAGQRDDLVARALLRFRHVDQSASYTEVEMDRTDGQLLAVVPGDYSDSPFAIQYHFVVHALNGATWLYPGLGAQLSEQPYFVVMQQAGERPRSTNLPPPTPRETL